MKLPDNYPDLPGQLWIKFVFDSLLLSAGVNWPFQAGV